MIAKQKCVRPIDPGAVVVHSQSRLPIAVGDRIGKPVVPEDRDGVLVNGIVRRREDRLEPTLRRYCLAVARGEDTHRQQKKGISRMLGPGTDQKVTHWETKIASRMQRLS